MNDNSLSIRARRKYKAQIEKAARENYIAKFNKRMEFAKQGVTALKNKDVKTALQCFHLYIEILQKSKGGGELTPQSFDLKKDAAEMLMLTGVFWDLAKIYDRVNNKEKSKLKYFLDKFVLFSKGASYQTLSLEMVRKFLTNENPRNRAAFKEAYVKLGGGKCFIATSVEEHCQTQTLFILRQFRDEMLNQSEVGKILIRIYYAIGPFIAIRLIRSPEVTQKRVAQFIDRVAISIKSRFFRDEM